jgi:hypothetical protein
MARMGELVLKSGNSKSDLIKRFLNQTQSYLIDLDCQVISATFMPTLVRFSEEFYNLKNEKISDSNKFLWAEKAITWADILQIRSRLI